MREDTPDRRSHPFDLRSPLSCLRRNRLALDEGTVRPVGGGAADCRVRMTRVLKKAH